MAARVGVGLGWMFPQRPGGARRESGQLYPRMAMPERQHGVMPHEKVARGCDNIQARRCDNIHTFRCRKHGTLEHVMVTLNRDYASLRDVWLGYCDVNLVDHAGLESPRVCCRFLDSSGTVWDLGVVSPHRIAPVEMGTLEFIFEYDPPISDCDSMSCSPLTAG